MQEHIQIGRQYPQVDNHTTYSFGLDDQEFVVAFDTDDVGAFLDLVQDLRSTEASAYTLRDTPSFTCIARLARAGAQRARRRADPGARRPRLTAWTRRSRTCAGPTPCSRACSTSSGRPT